jgi:type III pantothenate kinase
MNLAIDIGNSFTHFAVYSGKKPIYSSKCESKDFSAINKNLRSINKEYEISSAGLSSVIPVLNLKISKSIYNLFKIKLLIINNKSKLPVFVKIKSTATVGADRICNAVFGFTYFKRKENVLIADLGTANTFDIITKKGEFIGGIIAPGIITSAKALNSNTGKLPLLEFKKLSKNASLIGKNTFEAIQSGLVNYMNFAVEGIVRSAKKQLKGNLKVIITGGSTVFLNKNISFKYKYIQNTVLDGINIILNYQKSSKLT